MVTNRTFLGSLLALCIGWSPAFAADDPVKIGVIYPLTGATASVGSGLKIAIEVAMEIVNNPHPELPKIPLAVTQGLPNLGGRKCEAVFADHQGNPAVAQSQALRMITQEKVVALAGTYTSSTTLTASAIAERYGIPFIAGEASSPALTERGFKWFFRPTSIGTDFGQAYAAFLQGLKAQGRKVDNVALIAENTEYGTSVGDAIATAVEGVGLKVSLRIPYAASSADVSSQVLQLKEAKPDVAIFVSYTPDAILFIKTMYNLDYKPPILIGDDSGFSDPTFVTSVGNLAEGAINRSVYEVGKPGTNTYLVNDLFKKVAGRDLDEISARGLQSFLIMCDAINRAGSTEPAKIQAALKATNMSKDELMIGYNGVKFDEKGQTTLGATLLVQLRDGKYVPVWPKEEAATAVQLPFKGWDK